jgi:hypothetical protein
LQVWSLIYTFGLPNPQLTPSHETLYDTFELHKTLKRNI